MGILEFALIYDEVNQLLMVNILRAKVAISRDDEIFELFDGFAVFLSQASVFNKISKISKIFIEIERLSMP